MVNLLSKKHRKVNRDVEGYYKTCGGECSETCTGQCREYCSGICNTACGSACTGSCWGICHKLVLV